MEKQIANRRIQSGNVPLRTVLPSKDGVQLGGASSPVNPFRENRVKDDFVVWSHFAPAVKDDPDRIFAKLLILPGSTRDRFKVKQIDPPGHETEIFEVNASDCFHTNDGEEENYDHIHDVGSLPHANAAAVLDFLQRRWHKNLIYTRAGSVLYSLNPFEDIGIWGPKAISCYHEVEDVESLPPHIFSVGRKAMETCAGALISQSIVMLGESGSGKTETLRHLIRFFAGGAYQGDDTLHLISVQDNMMAINALFEAMGNAVINGKNSSRFCRYTKLLVGGRGGIRHGHVKAFLLEKSRIIERHKEERSFNIFYQMIFNMDVQMKRRFFIFPNPHYYNYLKLSNANKCLAIDDAENWRKTLLAFKVMGFTLDEIDQTLATLSSILLLGNIAFPIGSRVSQLDKESLQIISVISNLLGIENAPFEKELIKEGKKGVDILAETLYENLFLKINQKFNSKVNPIRQLNQFIGLLDISGFVSKNSPANLEQFLLNTTTEVIQKHFLQSMFTDEEKTLAFEGVASDIHLSYGSNDAVVSALYDPNNRSSVLAALEEKKLGFSVSQFLKSVEESGVVKPLGSSETSLIVSHSSADVIYNASSFAADNLRKLNESVIELIKKSKRSLISSMFEDNERLRDSLIIKYYKDLKEVMNNLNNSECHYIGCINPNATGKAHDWKSSKVLNQIFNLSLLESAQLKEIQYIHKRSFKKFIFQFKYLLKDQAVLTPDLSDEKKCYKIIKELGIKEPEFKLGKSRVLLSRIGLRQLNMLYRKIMDENYYYQILMIEAFLKKHLLYLKLKELLPSLLRFQARARAFLKMDSKVIDDNQESTKFSMLLESKVVKV